MQTEEWPGILFSSLLWHWAAIAGCLETVPAAEPWGGQAPCRLRRTGDCYEGLQCTPWVTLML